MSLIERLETELIELTKSCRSEQDYKQHVVFKEKRTWIWDLLEKAKELELDDLIVCVNKVQKIVGMQRQLNELMAACGDEA